MEAELQRVIREFRHRPGSFIPVLQRSQEIVGYLPPSPLGEGSVGILPMARPWLLPLVTALGGLLSGIIVFSLAPEAEGHGTDAAIDAIHHHAGRIRARIPPIKLVASAITIGTGGSGGREGPTAQISAAFGSLLALGLAALFGLTVLTHLSYAAFFALGVASMTGFPPATPQAVMEKCISDLRCY